MAGSEEKKDGEQAEGDEKMDFEKIQSLDEQHKAAGHMSDILSSNHFSVQKKEFDEADQSLQAPQVDITIQEDHMLRNFKSADKGEHQSMSDINVQALGGSGSKAEPNKSQDILLQSPEKETPEGQTPG